MVVIRKPLWSTPDVPTSLRYECRKLTFPSHLIDAISGALTLLLHEDLWVESGTQTVEDTVEFLDIMFFRFKEGCVSDIGQIIPHVLTTLPTNWLACDGQTHSRIDYPELYSNIDPGFIIDADLFRVPDLRDTFMKGDSATETVGTIGGSKAVSLTAAQNGRHRHFAQNFTYGTQTAIPGPPNPTGVGLPSVPVATTRSGQGAPHENQPQYITLSFAIVAM